MKHSQLVAEDRQHLGDFGCPPAYTSPHVLGMFPDGLTNSPAAISLVCELKSYDTPQRLHAIFPGNFLTLFVGAARIADRHFINPP